ALPPCRPAPASLFEPGRDSRARRFLVLFLPYWATQYLKRAEPELQQAPLALYARVKGGLRLVALDPALAADGFRPGLRVAEARAIRPDLVLREIEPARLAAAFGALADWHVNASPLVAVLGDGAAFGDLVLDITGVAHLFGGEAAMLRRLLARLRAAGYTVAGAVAPSIGAAWAVSHFSRSRIVAAAALTSALDPLPPAALRLTEAQVAGLHQMGLRTLA